MNPQHLEQIHGRLNPHIDPSLHIWGWEIPVYLFLGGVVAGVMILIPLLELSSRRKATSSSLQAMPFIALGLLGLGMTALFLDLANKLHVYRFYMTFRPSSVMSWGSWILLFVVPALIALGLSGLNSESRERLLGIPRLRKQAPRLHSLFAWFNSKRAVILKTNLMLGASVGIYTGLLLGSTVARLPWNSAILGPLFLVSGISTAAAFLLLFRLDDATRHTLVKLDVLAIVVELAFLAIFLLALQTGSAAARAGAQLFLGGAYTAQFWGLVIALGLVVPLILNLVEMKRGLAATLMSPTLVLVGGFALRAIFVASGQSLSFGDF